MLIDTINTDSWGSVVDYEIGTPEIQTRYIDIPGRNGSIDATDALLGYPTYKNRTIRVDIKVVKPTLAEFDAIYDEIYRFCHGQVRKLRFNLDLSHYYIGRCSVSVKQESQVEGTVTITCNAEPYAYNNEVTIKPIAVGDIEVSSTMPTDIILKATSTVKGSYEGTAFEYSTGTHKIVYPRLIGDKTIKITQGTGTIEYQEGKL